MKRLITLLLAIVMIASMFAACGSSDTPGTESGDQSKAPESSGTATDAPTGSTGAPSGESTNDPAISETTPPEDTEELSEYEKIGIPELNYNNATINIACWNSEQPEFDISADDANTGDPILDAIYKKNLYTEQTLGVELEFIVVPGAGNQTEIVGWCDTVKNMQSDPSTPVDILACYSRTAAYATISGLNQDLTVYDYIDLSMEWWPKNVQEEFSIGDKLFFITGDISTNVLHMMYCIFYNKIIISNHGLSDPVEMVKDRTWTMDAWQNMTAGLYSDTDGIPGKSAGDNFGAGFQYYHLDSVVQGCGFNLVENTNEAGQYITISEDFYSQKLDNFISNMIEWVSTNDVWSDINYGANGSTETAFLEGRSAFQINRAQYGFHLQDTDLDYGIVPPPMLDPDQQESYETTLGNPYTIYSMSRSTNNGDRAAAVLQTMGYYGKLLTTPAIFDVTFKGKFSKDPNAIDMFNLVRDSIGFDLGILYATELNYMCDMITNKAISQGQQWSTIGSNAFAKKTMTTKLERVNKTLETVVNA